MRYVIFSVVLALLLVWLLLSHPPAKASDMGDAVIRHMLDGPTPRPAPSPAPCVITFVTLPDGRVMQCQQCSGGQIICA